MSGQIKGAFRAAAIALISMTGIGAATPALATGFTSTVPGTGVTLPPEYPEAGGVAIVLTGVNGNIYYQFSNPAGAFRGFQSNGQPAAFRGNPFTINNPIALDCGFRDCDDYFGGAIAQIDVRFSAYDGDTQVGGFDEDDINLVMNGYDVGNWSGRTTEITDNSGTTSFGFANGFGNNTFNTGWFSSNNAALLNNILTTGQTTTQVRDDDPNDNYWDFRRGNSLSNNDIRTIAPGYELEKTRRGGDTTFLAVGQVITYDYVVSNIGSVRIDDITVFDDKIGSVTCVPTSLDRTISGTSTEPEKALCEAEYEVTQADVDAGELTNIAVANGVPEFGELGELEAEVTLTGPAKVADLLLEKEASPTSFTVAGQTINYTLTVSNEGNTTLTNVVVTDPDIPGFSCVVPELLPLSADNTDNTEVCTGSYVTDQDDVDNAAQGNQLINDASARGRDPDNNLVTSDASATVTGPANMPDLAISKSALTGDFDAVGDVLQFEIALMNTGNVTWPDAPAVDDPSANPVTCPSGPVAPGATITCTASYTVDQDDLDAGEVVNEATASITINGTPVEESSTATVPADLNPVLELVKSLATGPDPYSAENDELTYSYLLSNTGNVRLDAVDLTDDLVAVVCPATTIAAGDTMTCVSTADPYVIDQGDLDDGSVTNIATANAQTPDGTAIDPVTDTVTVDADQAPALGIVKSGALATTFASGQDINYSFVVTNTGNVTLDGPFTVQDSKFVDPIACSAGALAPGDTVTCLATYEITVADVTADFVSNVAYATDGTTDSPTDDFSISPTGEPGLTLTKVATETSFDSAADTINYTYTITNTGTRDIDTAASPITIADDKIDFADFSCTVPPILFASNSASNPKSYECSAAYDVQPADVDAGEVVNVATANVTISGSAVASPEVTENVPADITPDFTFAKAAAEADFDAVGDIINYTFTVTNLTEQTLASVVIDDPLLGGVICTLSNIGPFGVDSSCTAMYSVQQADLDNGMVDNDATATATSSTGTEIEKDADASVPFDVAAADRSLTVDKRASTATYAAVGDRIDYIIDVFNNGNLTLTDIVVTDAILGVTCNLGPLAPNDTDSTCTGSYFITQDDIDTGTFANFAQVSADGGAIDEDDTETATGPTPAPDYEFTKVADGDFAVEGDQVVFTLTVTNTGNTSLDAITISDDFFDPDLSCAIGTLLPGESDATCMGTYSVTQADVDAGEITNVADITVTPPSGVPEVDTATETVNGPAENPAMSVTKTEGGGSPDGMFVAGGTETFQFEVTNTGNVTLTNLSLTDAFFDPDFVCDLPDLGPGDSTVLCDDGVTPLQVVYNVQQSDVDFGAITNTVVVNGETDLGTTLEESDALTLTGPKQLPALMIDKSSPDTTFAMIDDELTYDYVVTNTGNITITSQITVADDKATVTCDDIGTGLAPLQTLNCTAIHTVTQDDLDAGEVTNIATANVVQPVVPSTPEYPDGVANISSAPDSVTIDADQMPELELAKRIQPGTPATYSAVDDPITFEFVVTNTGNVTTTDPIIIDDTGIGVNFECSAAPLAPGATVSCTTVWEATQTDIDNGSFTNLATAQTDFGGITEVSDPDDATALAVQTPEMTVVKEFTGFDGVGFTSTSDAEYIFRVTNTGNVTIAAPITIEDSLIGAITCSATDDLAPTDPEITCTGTYDITAQDVAFGSVTNTAIGKSPTVDSDPTSETIPNNSEPSIEITKAADLTEFTMVGDIITYTYTVKNTSPGDPLFGRPSIVDQIVIEDDNITDENGATLGQLNCFPTATVTELLPDQQVTCTQQGSYTVQQGDLDAVMAGSVTGFVTNNATGIIDIAQPVSSPPVQITVPGVADPVLIVTKAVTDGENPASAGDELEYTITVTNDGNQTIVGLVVEDAMLSGLTCDYTALTAENALSPTEAVECVGTYIVQQSDINAQMLENTATATGTNLQGTTVTDDGMITHPLDPAVPSVGIEKTLADGEPDSAFSAVDQEITYNIAVTNTGNTTLLSTTVTDILFPGQECLIGPLEPNDVDTSCAFVYTVTQEDLNAGEVLNEATAKSIADAPGNPEVEDSDDITAEGPDAEPEVGIVKVADRTSFDAEGQIITYTYTISNNGNVTLTSVPSVSDDKIDAADLNCTPPASGELDPGEFFLCTADYVVTQDDVDDGGVTNIATATVPDPNDPLTDLEAEDTVTVDSVREPAFTLVKSAPGFADVEAGETITYQYRVENTGNVTLSDVTLVDEHTAAAGTTNLTILPSNVITTLDVDEVVTLTAEYVVTQGDLDAGRALTNDVSADATPPVGVTPPATQTDDLSIDVADADPSLEVVKTVTPPALLVAGQPVEFTITVENTGNVTLDNVVLDDTLSRADNSVVFPDPSPNYDSGDGAPLDKLGVDETWTYTFTHVLTQADIDAGGLSNTVTATADDPFNFEVDDVSNNTTGAGSTPTTLTIPADPSIDGTKSITSTGIEVGDLVRFEIEITNTGNVTLTNVAVADDELRRNGGIAIDLTSGPTFFEADMNSGAGTLMVGETAVYRATYRLTQDDVDAGGIDNRATVTGEDPSGTDVDDTTNRPELVIPADPSIDFLKELTGGGPSFDAVDDVLEYTFTITNTGNVTLTGAPTITDALITDAGGTFDCESGPLAPDDSLICTAEYSVTQDDINNGSVDNSATAVMDGAPSDPSTTTTPAVQNPALETVKAAVSITTGDPAPNDVSTTIDPEYFETGAEITYSYTVTNTGNVTLAGPISVADSLIAGPFDCDAVPVGGLLPDGELVCTAVYVVTNADVEVAAATNVASTTMSGTKSPDVSVTVPAGADPAISVLKELIAVNDDTGRTDFDTEGDKLTYRFTVTNTGDAAFARDVDVNDPLVGAPFTCYDQDADPLIPNLVVGGVATCEADIFVTQPQLDAGQVVNQAYAVTLFGADMDPVSSGTVSETVPADIDEGIEIVKTSDVADFTAPLQDIEYTLTVTNTGNQTLTSVVARDDMLGLTCNIGTLAPGDSDDCSATYTTDQDDVDRGFILNEATVSSVDPRGDAVSDDDEHRVDGPDPNPMFTLVKSAMPDPFGAVGTGVTYTFTVENIGNVTLTDLTITDDIVDPPFACTITTLAVGDDDDTCTLSYTVTQDDKDAAEIENTATAQATAPDGSTTNAEDTITTDSEPTTSLLKAIKTADVPSTTLNSVVTYTLTLRNLGDVTLDIDDVDDTMSRRDFFATPTALTTSFSGPNGDADGDGRLDVTEVWTYEATKRISQADIDAGGFDNTVVVTATDPFGDDASDTSDDGDDGDGNTDDDPTEVAIIPGPSIEATKTLTQGGSAAGDEVVFAVVVRNTGNVTLANIEVEDTMTRADDDATVLVVDDPVLVSPTPMPDSIAPQITLTYEVRYTLLQEDVDAGGISNSVLARATAPDGTPTRDVSDNGIDDDGNTTNDPTILTILPEPAIEAVKTVVERDDPDATIVVGDVVEFDVTVTNTGTVTLSDVAITDTLTNGNGDPLEPDSVVFSDGDDELIIAPGLSNVYRVTYTLTQADIDSGSLENTVLAEGTTPMGEPVSDISDNGNDDDDNTEDDPTVFIINAVSTMEATKEASTPELVRGSIYRVTFDMTVTNTGNVTQTGVQVRDDLADWADPAVIRRTTRPAISGWSGAARSNANFDGVDKIKMLVKGVDLAPGDVGTLQITVTYDTATGFPEKPNVISVTSDLIDVAVTAEVEIDRVAEPDIFASKSVAPEEALLGATVTYTLMFENRLGQPEPGLSIIDDMPAGVLFTPGTVQVDGEDFRDPRMNGRQLRWNNMSLAPFGTLTLTFDARVVGDIGEMTNRTYMLGPDGDVVSNVATATLIRRPEPVFDCGDVIGKVFDDRNMNGYQDGVVEPDRSAVTDQTYQGGKFTAPPQYVTPDHEPGLPNVRLSTVTGTQITTDEYGRFSVPCAELPADIGSNFLLKLDERTLPTGYIVTTENPRVIRLTQGTVAKMNFGAALGNVLDIDLMAAAFAGDQPSGELVSGIDGLVAQLGGQPTLLNLTYVLNGETRDAARARLDAVETLVRDRWRGGGLRVERTIRVLQ